MATPRHQPHIEVTAIGRVCSDERRCVTKLQIGTRPIGFVREYKKPQPFGSGSNVFDSAMIILNGTGSMIPVGLYVTDIVAAADM
jgi:hypothetical protein